ncbi:hypothetical protein ACTNDG_03925 [Clostridium sp. HCP1S3_B4]|uniref:hypothetical protein n=1 Tax=unclassified Clostridium TaxID=2614128 RepID=UPI003F8C1AAE
MNNNQYGNNPNNYQNNQFNTQNNGYNNYNVPQSADPKPLIFGILAFLGILIPLAGYGFGIAALVISIKGKKNPYNKYNTAGIVLSIIALIISVINHIIGAMMIANIL